MREIKQKKISVEYLDSCGDDKRVTNVARVSFAKWQEGELTQADVGLLSYLATGLPKDERNDWENMAKAATHFMPFCHCFLTIKVGVPIFLARQLAKHQVGLAWSEESRRYIKEDVAYWLPDVVHKAPENSKQGASKDELRWKIKSPVKMNCNSIAEIEVMPKEFLQLSSEKSIRDYYQLLDLGAAPEEARIILPQNAMTNFIWSGSLLAFNRVYQLRKDSHAQGAAQEFAAKLGKILYEHFPESMKALNYGESLHDGDSQNDNNNTQL